LNLFMIVIGAMYVGAAGWEFFKGNKLLTVVYLAWSVSNIALALKR